MVMIPPRHGRWPLPFSTWDDSLETMRRFVLRQLADRPRLLEVAGEDGQVQLRAPVVVNLVPRPDNPYNSRAISVASAPATGGSHRDRHLGYLYDRMLGLAGALHTLADAASPTPIGCHGWIALRQIDSAQVKRGGRVFDPRELQPGEPLWSWCSWDHDWDVSRERPFSRAELVQVGYRIERIYLDLPLWRRLDALIYPYINRPLPTDDYYAMYEDRRGRVRLGATPSTGRVVTATGARQPEQRAGSVIAASRSPRAAAKLGREQKKRDAAANEDLAAWRMFRSVPHDYQGIRAITRAAWGNDRVLITDRQGLEIGLYRPSDGLLTLVDERTRPDAVEALRAHGIEPPFANGLDHLTDYPDALIRTKHAGDDSADGNGIWSILLLRDEADFLALPEAGWYDSGSGKLAIYAQPHVEPLTTLLRRHGIEPSSITQRPPDQSIVERNARAEAYAAAQLGPFRLADKLFRDPNEGKRDLAQASCRLTRRAIDLVPQAHRRWLNAEVVEGPSPQIRDFLSDIQRSTLSRKFNSPDTEDKIRACRLCGADCHGTASGIAYCLDCLTLSSLGILRDSGTDGPWTDATIWALRKLAEIEFGGPPSRSQLTRILLADPDLADLAMLCRFLIPLETSSIARPARKPRRWADWVRLAGLTPDATRRSRGTETVATDGHPCRSMLERRIDDFLHQHGIAHEIEPHYPRHPVLNTTGLRADWLLADGTYMEALGMMENSTYAAKVQRKLRLVEVTGTRMVMIRPEDVGRLPELLSEWMT